MESSKIGSMCFVIMPFSNEFKNQWELAIQPAIKEAGLTQWRGDEDSISSNVIMKDVTKFIYEAKIIIAELTQTNPNVMYELGLAHAARKPVIILFQSKEEVPFDLKHIRHLRYDPQNLKALERDLLKSLKNVLNMKSEEYPNLFPELKIMKEEEFEDLRYFRTKAPKINVKVAPSSADIFFNDKLIGQSPQKIRINIDYPRNTISVAAIQHFEHHADVSSQDVKDSTINIKLEPQVSDKKSDFNRRVPQWLRFRRRDPNNPVLMRAICAYLLAIGDIHEAIIEAEELLEIAPYWYMAHNQAGIVKFDNNPKEAEAHFSRVIALKPDHCVGYYNLACMSATKREYERCLEYINMILKSKKRIKTFLEVSLDLKADPDFKPILKDKGYRNKMLELNNAFLRQKKELGFDE